MNNEELEKKIDKEIQDELDQEQEELSSIGFIEKAKKYIAKARFSRYVSLISVIVAIMVFSLTACGWDPSRIGWGKFIADTSLLIFIGVYGIFFGENEGSQRYKNALRGLYKTCLIKFRKLVARIRENGFTDLLPDYILWRYQKDYDNVCQMKLLSVRLFNKKILNLNYEQLEQLKNHPIKVGENADDYFDKITEKQYQLLVDIKSGNVIVDYFEDYNFYLMEDNTNEGKQMATIVKETPKRKEKITWQQRLSRIIMIALSSIIVAGFIKESLEGNSNAGNELASRLVTLFVSIASGINTARLLNIEDCFVLKYKISYNEVFLVSVENGHFTPIDYNQKAKESYEQWEKEQEESKKNVVYPETLQIEDKTIYK